MGSWSHEGVETESPSDPMAGTYLPSTSSERHPLALILSGGEGAFF